MPLNRRNSVIALLTATLVVVGFDASAGTFTDKAAFLAASNATSATGPIPNDGGQGLGPHTIGSVTYTSAASTLFFDQRTELMAGFELAISDSESFNLDFAAPVFAVGFEWVDPEVQTTFTLTLKSGGSGGTVVGTPVVFSASSPSVAQFIGVTATSSFDRAEIRENSANATNEYFGEVFTAASSEVPEPGAAALVACACAALTGRRRGR